LGFGLLEGEYIQFGGVNIQAFALLGRTSLGAANATISVASLPSKKWLLVLAYLLPTASLTPWLRLNNISTGTPYADRTSTNGAADTTDASANQSIVGTASANPQFIVMFIENTASGEKIIQYWTVDQNTAGVANITNRLKGVSKWADTTNPINEIDLVSSTSTFAINSEVIVLGADPSDVNVTPFFNEIGRKLLAATSTTCNVIGVVAKKYLFVTKNIVPTTSNGSFEQFNNDAGTDYNVRSMFNGGADNTFANEPENFNYIASAGATAIATPFYLTEFIINVTANEKLSIKHMVSQTSSGVLALNRGEVCDKWTNTASQITEIDMISDGGSFQNGTEVVVMGAN
jgi:hypothetical protein